MEFNDKDVVSGVNPIHQAWSFIYPAQYEFDPRLRSRCYLPDTGKGR